MNFVLIKDTDHIFCKSKIKNHQFRWFQKDCITLLLLSDYFFRCRASVGEIYLHQIGSFG